MYNNSEHCCLSCGEDISDKRIDAKYCSDKCRMQYRRNQKKRKLIEELAQIFSQLPNHSAQRTGQDLMLHEYDVLKGSSKIWQLSDLYRMSEQALKELIQKKRWLLAGQGVANLFNKKS